MLTEQTVRGPAGHTYREKVFDRQVAGADARRGLDAISVVYRTFAVGERIKG